MKNLKRFAVLLFIGVGCATGDVSDSSSSPETKMISADSVPAASETSVPSSNPAVTPSPTVAEAPASTDPVSSNSPASPVPEVSASPAPDANLLSAMASPMPESSSPPETSPSPSAASTPAVPTDASATSPVVAPSAPENSASLTPTSTASTMSPSTSSPAEAEVPVELKYYTVRKYDTLMKISNKIYGDPFEWDDIYQLNKDIIQSPNLIKMGMHIRYKPPVENKRLAKHGHKYVIQAGDTLTSIAQNIYGAASKWKDLWSKNNDVIHNPEKIMAGLVIYYSGKRVHSSQSAGRVQQQQAEQSAESQPAAPQAAAPQAGVPQSAAPTEAPAGNSDAPPVMNGAQEGAQPAAPGSPQFD